MSVSESAGQNDEWELLEKQPIVMSPVIPSTASNGQYQFKIPIPVAGGVLGRDERAELVAFEKHGTFVTTTGAGQNTHAQVHGYWELSREADFVSSPAATREDTEQRDLTPEAVANGGDSSVTLTDNTVEVDDIQNNLFAHGTPHQEAGFENSTDGTGGSGSMHMDHQTIDYRGLYGQGPVLHQDDDMNLNWALEKTIDANGVIFYFNGTLVWDIL